MRLCYGITALVTLAGSWEKKYYRISIVEACMLSSRETLTNNKKKR